MECFTVQLMASFSSNPEKKDIYITLKWNTLLCKTIQQLHLEQYHQTNMALFNKIHVQTNTGSVQCLSKK